MRQTCAPRAVAFALGGRVICVRDDSHVPFGTRATVVGFQDTLAEVVLDSSVLGASTLGGRCSMMRGASLPMTYFLNLSPKDGKAKSSGPKGGGKGNSSKAQSKSAGKGGKANNSSEVSQVQGTAVQADWDGKPQFPYSTAPNNLPEAKAKRFENQKKLIPARKEKKFAPPVPKAAVQYSETNQYSAAAAPAEGYDSDGEEIMFVPISKKKPSRKPKITHPAQKVLLTPSDMVQMQQQGAAGSVQGGTVGAQGKPDQTGNNIIQQLANNLQMPSMQQLPQRGAMPGNTAVPPPQPLFAMMPPPIPGMPMPMMPPPQGMSMPLPMPFPLPTQPQTPNPIQSNTRQEGEI